METQTDTTPTGQRILLFASAALLFGVAVHGLDHVLQDRGIGALTTEVRIGGFVNALAAVLVFVLARRADPRAPVAAAAVGAYIALGVVAAHFLPHWSALSDPYAGANLSVVSWAAAGFEAACALALAAVGLAVQRRRRMAGHLALR